MIENLKEAILRRDSDAIWRIAAESWDDVVRRSSDAWPHLLEALEVADGESVQAIATCVLEHVLEHDFSYFDLVEREIEAGNEKMLKAFLMCSKFGQSKLPQNEQRWDALVSSARPGRSLL